MREGREGGREGSLRASTGRKTLQNREGGTHYTILHASRRTRPRPRRFTALGKGKCRYRQSAEQTERSRSAESAGHDGSHSFTRSSVLTQFRWRVVGRLHAMRWARAPTGRQAGGQAGRTWKLKVDRSRGTWRAGQCVQWKGGGH